MPAAFWASPIRSRWNGAGSPRCGPVATPTVWIAATAIVHDLIIVTRNVVDFDDTGATVINPWEAGERP